MASSRVAVIAWVGFQPRTRALARELGTEARFIHAPGLARYPALLGLRYLRNAWLTWHELRARDPEVVVAVTPPVVAPGVAWAWSALRRRRLVVDCHTSAFGSRRWLWALPVHRWLFRRSTAVLLHTDEAARLVRSWGAPGIMLPDEVPGREEAELPPARPGLSVLVAGSLDANEPVLEALQAAALMPGVRFLFTGDIRRLPPGIVASAPANVRFTGWLPYPRFLGEMLAASVTAVFSTEPGIMNRAAFEAVGLNRPLVLSDLPGLRERFGRAALTTANEPAAMAETLRRALRRRESLEASSRALRAVLARQHADAVERLRVVLGPAFRSPAIGTEREARTG